MQGDIKDVPASLEPCGQPAQLNMVLKQQYRMADAGKAVGAGQAAEA